MDVTIDATPRRLATLEQVLEVAPIVGADAIERIRIRGWDVVAKLGQFAVGDVAVYVEVDSMLDVTDERFAFLAPRGVRTDATGWSGHVLKTARLRGQYSQGLALPIAEFPELVELPVGADVTGRLGIVKWDPPIPAHLSGLAKGPRPSWIPMTDEERVQNLSDILLATRLDGSPLDWAATEKIDGTSTSIYRDGADAAGVCSRKLDLIETEGNTLWAMARRLDLFALLGRSFPGARAVLQGETYGEGIQGNPLKLRGQHFAAFTLLVDGREVPRSSWPEWMFDIAVPLRALDFPATLEGALADVDGLRSVLADAAAEGVVWRALSASEVLLPDGRVVRASFKVISNKYLLKHDR